MASFTIFILNLGDVFNFSAPNVIEKGMFLLTAAVFLITRKRDPVVVILTALAFIVIFLPLPFIKYPGFSWSIFLNALNTPFIIFAFLIAIPEEEDQRILPKFISLLPILSALLGIIYQILGLRNAYGIEFSTGLARFSGSLIPAYLSGLGLVGTFAAIQCLLRKERFALLICATNFGILLAAGGRAALASTILVCGASILFTNRVALISKIRVSVAALVGALLFVAIFWDRIITRFEGSGDNGRDLMASYLTSLHGQYPAGIGFGHQFFSVPEDIRIIVGSFAAHNDFLKLQVEIGDIAAIAFYSLYALAILRIVTRKWMRSDIMVVFAFASFLLLSRTDNALATPAYFPLVFLAYLGGITFKQDSVRDKIKPHRPPEDFRRRPKGIAPSIFPVRPS